jgi:hypothetical protein
MALKVTYGNFFKDILNDKTPNIMFSSSHFDPKIPRNGFVRKFENPQ